MPQKRVRSGKTRWVGRYRDPAGRERSRTFDTRREAAAWEQEREREMRRGEWLSPVHPHIRGGEPRENRVPPSYRRIFPAYEGVNPAESPSSAPTPYIPRVCGGEPAGTDPGVIPAVYSPHTRG